MKLKYNLDDMYFHYARDHYFIITIDFLDRWDAMFDFIIQFLYKKLVSANVILKNISSSETFWSLIDLVGLFQITLHNQNITVIVYIDARLKNRCELAKDIK